MKKFAACMTVYSIYDRLLFIHQEFLQTNKKYTERKMSKHEKIIHKRVCKYNYRLEWDTPTFV